MARLGALALVSLLVLSGCLQSSTERSPEPVAVEELPEPTITVPVLWGGENLVPGEPFLLEVTAANATDVVWLVDGQRLEGRLVQVTLSAGSHDVAVRYAIDGTYEEHTQTLQVGQAATEDPAETETPATVVPGRPREPGEPIIEVTVDRNRASFELVWDGAPSRVDWFFGDGGTSNQIAPTYGYMSPGTYTVRAVGWLGAVRATTATQVTIADVPLSFSVARHGDRVDLVANWDHDNGQYAWDFGDGSTATGDRVSHTYPDAGPFNITLRGTVQGDVEVTHQIVLLDDFPLTGTVELDANIAAFDAVWGFDNAEWTWYFGDGQRSNDRSPAHRYPAIGTYSVVVQATSGSYTNTTQFDVLVTEMKITIDALLDLNNLTTDAGWDLSPDNYTWSLGQGPERFGDQVAIDYEELGDYTVVLTGRSGPYVERTSLPLTVHTKVPIIHANVPPGNVVTFAFDWTHEPDLIRWTFGDGDRSNQAQPVHAYEDGLGIYTVQLTLSNPELRAVGIYNVRATLDVEVLFDGIPQFNCDGEPVYEPQETYGEGDLYFPDMTWAALKDGQRMAVMFTTPQPEQAHFRYFDGTWHEVNDTAAGTFHALILDGRTIGAQTCFEVTAGDTTSRKHVVVQENAMNRYEDGAYLINLLMTGPGTIPQGTTQAGTQLYATKLWDMTDGHVRAGMTWWIHDWAEYLEPVDPGVAETPCADEGLVQGTVEKDAACYFTDVAYVTQSRPGTAGTAPSMGIKTRWGGITMLDSYSPNGANTPLDATEYGSVLVHEFGHYGMALPDRYDAAPPLFPLVPLDACYDASLSLSVMGSNRAATELEDAVYAPCPDEELGPVTEIEEEASSWETLVLNYPLVPARTGLPDPGPDGDGDLFRFVTYDATGAP